MAEVHFHDDPTCQDQKGRQRTAELHIQATAADFWEPTLQNVGRKITHSGIRLAKTLVGQCFTYKNPQNGGSGYGGTRKEGKKSSHRGGAAARLPATWRKCTPH